MIARIRRGAVAEADGDVYADYVAATGLAGYTTTEEIGCPPTPWLLRRNVGGKTEVVTLRMWDSMEAIKAFAGEDPEVAVFYPEDDRFLVERDEFVSHYVVDRTAQP
jgi:hypothetical protein